MPKDHELKSFLQIALHHAAIVSGELPKDFYSEEESARLREEGQKLTFSTLWLNRFVSDVLDPNVEFRSEDWPGIQRVDEILSELFVAAYRIGAATWTHNANEKFVYKSQRPRKMRAAKLDALTDQDREDHRQALEVALAKPFKKPLGKANGNSARARRLLPAFNEHLESLGHAKVGQDVVEKMLRNYPLPISPQK